MDIKQTIEMAKHIFRGHNQNEIAIPGQQTYVECDCGQKWVM